MKYVAIALAAWNLIVFCVYGLDKYKAKKRQVAHPGKDAAPAGLFLRRAGRISRHAGVPPQDEASPIYDRRSPLPALEHRSAVRAAVLARRGGCDVEELKNEQV